MRTIRDVIIGLGLILLPMSGAAQFANGYSYRMPVTLNESVVPDGQDLTDFVWRLDVTSSNLIVSNGKVTSSNGYDITFTDAADNPLDFELVSFNSTTGNYVAWVEIPTLLDDTNTEIFIYYGNSSVTTDQSTTNTWSNSFVIVDHMESSGPANAVGNGLNPTDNTGSGTGKLGGARTFNGSGNTITYPDNALLDLTNNFTITIWVNSTNGASQPDLITKGAYDDAYSTWINDDDLVMETDDDNLNSNTNSYTEGSWRYLAFSWSSSGRTIYLDGQSIASDGFTTNSTTNGDPLNLSTTAFDYAGSMDEVRVISAVRSDNWIETEFNNQDDPASGSSLGVECSNFIYYSYQTGDYNNSLTWTTDPSGTTLQNSAVPGVCDSVVILSGNTITLDSDNLTIDALNIENGATLDVSNTSGSAINRVYGDGTIILRGDNLPTGDYNSFGSSSQSLLQIIDPGTASFPTSSNQWNDVEMLSNAAGSDVLTLSSDVQINGDLTLTASAGDLTFNLGNSTTARTLTVKGNVDVGTGTTMGVGAFDATHTFEIEGNLVANGDIDFTNSTQYATSTTGAVELTFSGLSNNTLSGTGSQLDLYRLILNKGTDQTYTLEVTQQNISMWGPINGSNGSTTGEFSDENPEINKAIWIRAGTLKLTSGISIPELSSGGIDFYIPANGQLWIDGADVSTTTTTGVTGNTAITVVGSFRITDGSFATNKSAGFIYAGASSVLIEGGTVTVSQFRPSGTAIGPSNASSFSISGGTFTCEGNTPGYGEVSSTTGLFDLGISVSSFEQTGGEIVLKEPTGIGTENGLFIAVDPANVNVTGGRVLIDTDDDTTFSINSTAKLYTLEIQRRAGSSDAPVQLASTLTIVDSIIVQANTALDGNGQNFVSEGHVEVLGTLTPGSGKWTANSSANKTWNLAGTISSFEDFLVDVSSSTLTIEGAANIDVDDSLIVNTGTLNLNGTRVDVGSTFANSGTTSGSQPIRFDNGTAFTWGGSGSGQTHNLEVSGTATADANVTLASDQIITTELEFISGNTNFDRTVSLGAFNLSLPSSTSITNAGTNGTGWNAFTSGGNASDDGLTIAVDALTTTFPLATSTAYTPATLTLSSAPSSYGNVTVTGADTEHPNITEAAVSLSYYWKVSSTISLGAATSVWEFNYDDSDIQGTESNYGAGRFSGVQWSSDAATSVDESTNTITFNNASFTSEVAGDYTAGDIVGADPFGAVETYYSIGNGAWSNVNTWSLTSHSVIDPPAQEPQSNSIVIIGDQDSVYITSGGELAGSVTIQAGASLDIDNNTGHTFGILSGQGRLRMNTGTFPSGDLDDFLGATGGTIVMYVDGGNRNFGTMNFTCRNLIWRLQTSNRLEVTGTINVIEDLYCVSDASNTQDFRMRPLNLNIGGNWTVMSGDFQFRNNDGVSNVDVDGDVFVGDNGRIQNVNNTNRIHFLNIGGSLTSNGRFDLYRTANRRVEVTFDGTGVVTIDGTDTYDLYTVIVDKGSDTTSQLIVTATGGFLTRTDDWLDLRNGLFVYNRSDTRTISDASFTIPSTAGIKMSGTGTIIIAADADDASDLILNGTLICQNGTTQIGNSANSNGNDIEYAAGGNPTIVVSGGQLEVNGQVRRGLSSSGGNLEVLINNGGKMTVRGINASTTKGMLEIVNSGTLTMEDNAELIFQRGGSASEPDLKISSGSSITSGTITFETASGIATSLETFTLNSEVDLDNLVITGAAGDDATIQLLTNALILQGDLTLTNAQSNFNSNELDVTIYGNVDLAGEGTWTNSTLNLLGSASNLDGTATGANAFSSLNIGSGKTVNVQSGADLEVDQTLTLNSGSTLSLVAENITVNGDATINGDITSSVASSTNGLTFNGSANQNLTASGSVDNLIINNSNGVTLNSDLTIDTQLELTDGVLDIQDHLLTFGTDAILSGTFSSSAMISTNGVLSDGGVLYPVSSGAKTVLLPVGSNGKYTPAEYDFTALSALGTINLIPVNVVHPSTTDANDTQLNYYWSVETTGLGTYTVSHQYRYNNSDITGTESLYVTGRFFNNAWTPEGGISSTVDNTNDSITLFEVDYMDGEYSAGESGEFGSAPIYYSRSASTNHNWDNPDSWSNDSHGGLAAAEAPAGSAKIIIAEGDSIFTNGNLRICQSVQNNGVLNVGNSIGHNFGRFNGSGRLILDVAPSNVYVSPAGIYTGFVSDTGGTWVYTGSVNAQILNQFTTYGGLAFDGTSQKTLGSSNLTIYNDGFTILNGTVSNSSNIDLTINGNWRNDAGSSAYSAGTGTVTLNSTSSTIEGSTNFYDLTVAKTGATDSVKLQNGTTTVTNNFNQTQGVLSLDNASLVMQGNVVNGTWYTDSLSNISITGSGTVSNALAIEGDNNKINNLTLSTSTSTSLANDLVVVGTLTLGSGNLAIGSNDLTIKNAISGTSASLQSTSSTRLFVEGTGSGIAVPSSVSNLKVLSLNNTNGLSLSGSVSLADTLTVINGTLNLSGNDLSMANNGWVERSNGSISGTMSYVGSGNIQYNNTSPITTAGEVPTSRTALQIVRLSGSSNVTLQSDLAVNTTLDLASASLSLASDSLILFGGVSGSGELISTGNGHLSVRGTGNLSIPTFNAANSTLSTLLLDRSGNHNTSSNLTVADKLILTDGTLNIQTNTLTLEEGFALTGGSNASFIATSSTGTVDLNTTATGTISAPVGDLTGTAQYSPIDINLSQADFAGTGVVSVSVDDAIATNCPGSTDYITRTWTLSGTNITNFEGTVTMYYVDEDIVGTEANIRGKYYNGSNCVNGDLAVVGSNTASVFFTSFGEFTGGEIDIAAEPTVAASNLAFSNVSKLDFDLNWTSGNGAQRIVVARVGSAVSFVPTDNEHYAFNSTYGTSTDLGSNQYAVYKGASSSFTVDGLDPNKTYHFAIFEFNRNDTLSENYLATSETNSQNTSLELDLITLFEGPLDTLAGTMSTGLNTKALIPTSQPFGSIYDPYTGTESASIPAGVSDWILIELYKGTTEGDVTGANKVHEGAYFLKSNGQVTALDGTSNPEILPDESGPLLLRIRSRNHLNYISGDTLTLVGDVHTLDTRTADPSTNTEVNVFNSWNTIPGGSVNSTIPNSIDINDGIQIWNARNAEDVYQVEDLNWDGNITAHDRVILSYNLLFNP